MVGHGVKGSLKQQKMTNKFPDWFQGEQYNSGEVVRNPFSGEEYELNNVELSIYDMIMGAQVVCEMMGGMLNPNTAKIQKEMAKGLDWFRRNNAEAYMVLLD